MEGFLLGAGGGSGDVDTGFYPSADGAVLSLALQPDGMIIVGGQFISLGGAGRNRLARLNADGSLDGDFNPNANGDVFSTAVQADGRIVVAGAFGSLQPNGAPSPTLRNRLARLNTDGTLDSDFNPNANGDVFCAAVQADARIVVAGAFGSLQPNGALSPTLRNRLARLNADGSLDGDFNPNANGDVFCAAVQADGRIVVAGAFSSLQPNGAPSPTPRNRLARLNADGTLDDEFNPNIDGDVRSVVMQADGKMVIAGSFLHVDGNERGYLARLNADGTLDGGFNPVVDDVVHGVILQAEGKVVIGGGFLNVGSWARERIARLLGDPVTESLTVPNLGSMDWMRWDSAPETHHVTFELSTDGGGNWTMLGVATRYVSGWELTGLTLPASGQVRARARTTGGSRNGSAGLVESVAAFDFEPEIVVEQPAGVGIGDGGTSPFNPVVVNANTSLVFTVKNTGVADLTGLGVTIDGANASDFTVIAAPSATVIGGGSTALTIRFAPRIAGARTAVLHIANNDSDEAPFDISLTGQALSFAVDTDGDGLNDASELQMATMGFDWQTNQTAMVNTYYASANGAGLFTQSQVQSLNVGPPLLVRNPANGQFTVTIGLEKAADLVNFSPFPMSAPQTMINGQGKVEFQFSVPDNTAFFRLQAQ